MLNLPIDQDELLRNLASESIRKGEDIRATVRDLTLKALQGRQTTLAQIRGALRSIAEGVNIGAAKSPIDPEALVNDAFAGMDDALLKVVEANRIALAKLTDGQSFEESQMKRALDELERYEDTLLRSVKQASAGATDKIRAQWAGVLKTTKLEGTDTGAHVTATLEQYGAQMQNALRETRSGAMKMAHALTRNYATLVSGVLIGLSEALQAEGAKPSGRRAARPAQAAPAPRAAAPAARKASRGAKKAAKKTAAKKTGAKKTSAKKAPAKRPAAKKATTRKG